MQYLKSIGVLEVIFDHFFIRNLTINFRREELLRPAILESIHSQYKERVDCFNTKIDEIIGRLDQGATQTRIKDLKSEGLYNIKVTSQSPTSNHQIPIGKFFKIDP